MLKRLEFEQVERSGLPKRERRVKTAKKGLLVDLENFGEKDRLPICTGKKEVLCASLLPPRATSQVKTRRNPIFHRRHHHRRIAPPIGPFSLVVFWSACFEQFFQERCGSDQFSYPYMYQSGCPNPTRHPFLC